VAASMQAAGGYGPAMQPNWGAQPASYTTPQPFPNPQGPSAGMQGPAMGGPMMGGGAMPVGYETGGGYFDGGYDGGYGGGYGGPDFFGRLAAKFLPYAEGGSCAPRWYDITMDAMYLTREDSGRNIDLSSDGINGDILLSTNDLDFNEELGFRLTAAKQIFAGATAEFTYFGLFNWSASAANRTPTNPDDIFSVLSNFGQTPFNGFDETDRAASHSISYSSTIDNFEMNFRKRFTAPNCRLQYSWLAGIRYVYLLEDFNYTTIGGGAPSRGSMVYDVRARNSLTGFQIGGDAWLNLVPGVNIGADIKAGVFGNYANQNTSILATTTAPASTTTFNESIDGNDVSLIADANLYFMWRLGPNWTVRAGYNFLFLEGVALGTENFNTSPGAILAGGASNRVAAINDDGNVFYHGGFGGLEYMW
jgi:hypothetical protein